MKRHLFRRMGRFLRPQALPLAGAAALAALSGLLALLVPLVENFRTRPGDLVVEQVVREYLQPLKDWGCDTLVLGCTHYPLLWDVIGAFMGPEVTLVNSGKEAACQLAETLKRADMLSGAVSGGTCKFYVSDTTEGFSQMASAFLEKPVEELVGKIDIERY